MGKLRSISLVVLAAMLSSAGVVRADPLFQEKDLFIAGLDGVNIYRIPSLLVTPKGVILAFCEAREGDDGGPTDLVLKRSIEARRNLVQADGRNINGVAWQRDRKWLPMQVVLPGDGEATMNPCPIVDRRDGTIWLCCFRVIGGFEKHIKGSAEYRTLVLKSTDEGATWSKPMDITASVGYFVPGPGVGIQLQSGRLVVSGHCKGNSAVMYSDDHAVTWQVGAAVAKHTNESQAVELEDGTLMLNMRSAKYRDVALSKDGGESWYDLVTDKSLIDSWGCQSSILRYTKQRDGFTRNRLLFANPADESSRVDMTVRLSYDEGETWLVRKTVNASHAAYSCLAVLPDGTICLLYETGKEHPYERIRFARFDLAWLTDGEDKKL